MSESTSARIARLAAEVLAGKKPTAAEARSLAGSVLTQVEPPKPKPPAKR